MSMTTTARRPAMSPATQILTDTQARRTRMPGEWSRNVCLGTAGFAHDAVSRLELDQLGARRRLDRQLAPLVARRLRQEQGEGDIGADRRLTPATGRSTWGP